MLCLKISRWHMGKSQETMQLSRLSRLLSLTLMGQRILSGIIDWCWNFSQYSIVGIGWTILLLFYLFALCLTKAEIWLEILRHLGSSRKGMFTTATVTAMYIVHYCSHYCYYSKGRNKKNSFFFKFPQTAGPPPPISIWMPKFFLLRKFWIGPDPPFGEKFWKILCFFW